MVLTLYISTGETCVNPVNFVFQKEVSVPCVCPMVLFEGQGSCIGASFDICNLVCGRKERYCCISGCFCFTMGSQEAGMNVGKFVP